MVGEENGQIGRSSGKDFGFYYHHNGDRLEAMELDSDCSGLDLKRNHSGCLAEKRPRWEQKDNLGYNLGEDVDDLT